MSDISPHCFNSKESETTNKRWRCDRITGLFSNGKGKKWRHLWRAFSVNIQTTLKGKYHWFPKWGRNHSRIQVGESNTKPFPKGYLRDPSGCLLETGFLRGIIFIFWRGLTSVTTINTSIGCGGCRDKMEWPKATTSGNRTKRSTHQSSTKRASIQRTCFWSVEVLSVDN